MVLWRTKWVGSSKACLEVDAADHDIWLWTCFWFSWGSIGPRWDPHHTNVLAGLSSHLENIEKYLSLWSSLLPEFTFCGCRTEISCFLTISLEQFLAPRGHWHLLGPPSSSQQGKGTLSPYVAFATSLRECLLLKVSCALFAQTHRDKLPFLRSCGMI